MHGVYIPKSKSTSEYSIIGKMVNMITSLQRTGSDATILLNRYLKRYLKFIFIGAFLSCATFNAVLHSGSSMLYYCQEECLEMLLTKPLGSNDKDAIDYIKNYYLDPPFPSGSFEAQYSLEEPPWSKMAKWGESHKFVREFFANYQQPGKFVEIGAQDGEFMSLSLWLEQVKGFTGLLVEPNDNDYRKLRSKKRSAYSIKACATPDFGHRKDVLWIRDLPEHLPILLKRIQEGSNRLLRYVAEEDRELGTEQDVQCFNTGSMIIAALKTLSIDFLSISTHGGELDIFECISSKIHIRMLAIVSPLASNEEYSEMKKLVGKRNMVEVHARGNVHIFLNKNEVVLEKVVKKG